MDFSDHSSGFLELTTPNPGDSKKKFCRKRKIFGKIKDGKWKSKP